MKTEKLFFEIEQHSSDKPRSSFYLKTQIIHAKRFNSYVEGELLICDSIITRDKLRVVEKRERTNKIYKLILANGSTGDDENSWKDH